jgi:hypothetical protein
MTMDVGELREIIKDLPDFGKVELHLTDETNGSSFVDLDSLTAGPHGSLLVKTTVYYICDDCGERLKDGECKCPEDLDDYDEDGFVFDYDEDDDYFDEDDDEAVKTQEELDQPR